METIHIFKNLASTIIDLATMARLYQNGLISLEEYNTKIEKLVELEETSWSSARMVAEVVAEKEEIL